VAKLKIILVKSAIGYPEDQKRTVRALGLTKLRQCAEYEDSGAVRGMITKVRHLVKVEAVESTLQAGTAKKKTRQKSAAVEEKS